MIIKCSNDPLYLTTLDDIAILFYMRTNAVYYKLSTNSEPLVDDVPNWKVTQIDAAFDIPLAATNDADHAKNLNNKKVCCPIVILELSDSNIWANSISYILKMYCIRIKYYGSKSGFHF